MSKAKRNSLLLLAVSAALVALLAMSLPRLNLAPGQPFSLDQQTSSVGGSSVTESNFLGWLLRGALAISAILLPIYIAYSLFSKEGRRRLLVNVIMLALLLFIADRVQKLPEPDKPPQDQTQGSQAQLQNGDQPPTAIFPEEPPAWLTAAVILVASAVVIGLGLLAYYLYRERHKPKPAAPLQALAEAAQNTIEAIQTGGDFKSSVIACYREMSRVVQEQRGIARDIAMTPREFEDVLIRRGLPGEAIRTLTRLFESVRYGSAPSGVSEIDQAVACLTEIAAACQSGAYARR